MQRTQRIPDVSIVIPCYNERARLPETITQLRAYVDGRLDVVEVIVVDNGSSDGTAAIAAELLRPLGEWGVVLANRENHGKGAAVRQGMLAAGGRVVLFTDADLSTPIEELVKLEQALAAGADVAIGSRAVDRSLLEVPQGQGRDVAGRLFNLVARALATPGIRDTQCGFKLFRTDAAQQICTRQRLNGFGFDVELIAIARHLGLAVAEVPVRWRNHPDSHVTLLRGAKAFLDPLRVRAALLMRRYGPRGYATRRPSRSISDAVPGRSGAASPS